MICKECGFEGNTGDTRTCKACGSALASGGDLPLRTIVSADASASVATPPTELGRQAGTAPSGRPDISACPKCHYPLQSGFGTCPECGATDHASQSKPQPPRGKTDIRQETRRIEDFQDANAVPECRLEPLNNRKREALQSSGGELRAGRKDIDPQDNSISSSDHFRIYRDSESGEWKLENTSSNQALFVQVKGTITLQPDTVIQVGQYKLFRFNPED